MIRLKPITEDNWLAVSRLSLTEEQQKFLDRPLGIIARGYIYRDCNARVFAISADGEVGFVDTGYIDEDLPECLNLMYYFDQEILPQTLG